MTKVGRNIVGVVSLPSSEQKIKKGSGWAVTRLPTVDVTTGEGYVG